MRLQGCSVIYFVIVIFTGGVIFFQILLIYNIYPLRISCNRNSNIAANAI